MGEGEKFIRLRSILAGNPTIIVENGYDGNGRMEGGKYRSSKPDGMGIGLAAF